MYLIFFYHQEKNKKVPHKLKIFDEIEYFSKIIKKITASSISSKSHNIGNVTYESRISNNQSKLGNSQATD